MILSKLFVNAHQENDVTVCKINAFSIKLIIFYSNRFDTLSDDVLVHYVCCNFVHKLVRLPLDDHIFNHRELMHLEN